MTSHQILLYYKYVPIEDPEALKQAHLEFGKKHNLKGRIIIAKEGINGTLEGTLEDSLAYQEWLKTDPRFSDMWFKKSPGTGSAFPRWSVKVRPEIVSLRLGEKDFSPTEITGQYLKPEELHQWLSDGKPVKIVDMRNDYEFKVGRFVNSFLPKLKNFRDLRRNFKLLFNRSGEDEPIVTVCTGGVRCEKASGYLVKQGFKNVYQLEGGIVSYMEKFPKGFFQGKLYVFDNRVVMGVPGGENQPVIGRCDHCGQPSERYINCANPTCHDKLIMCEDCDKRGLGTCGLWCKWMVKEGLPLQRLFSLKQSWTDRLKKYVAS